MQSRQWIFENKTRGVHCPTCERFVKEYRRTVSPTQAASLKKMHDTYEMGFVNLGKIRTRLKIDQNGELTKLAHWKLLRQHSTRNGLWAVTEDGANWITGRSSIPQSVYLYQGELTGQCTHRCNFQDAINGDTCHHGVNSDDGSTDPYREKAQPSDGMFNFKTLSDRRSKIARYADGEDDLFGELTKNMSQVENPLIHDVFAGDESIQKAKEWVERKLDNRGGFCPSCDKIAAYNRTKITDAHARLIIEIYKRHGMESAHVPSLVIGNDAVGKLGHASESAHRGLLSVDTERGGGSRSGWYHLTDEGIRWIHDQSTTPESIWSYNRFSRKIEDGKQVKVTEVFDRSNRFWYSDLMPDI